MKKILVLTLLIGLFTVAPAQSQADVSVVLQTDPPANQIGPDDTFAKTTLTVVDSSGQPISDAYLKLHLDSPPGNAFISTDFPIVENTPLMNFEGNLPDGVLEFEYIFPIRGVYNFEVEAGRNPLSVTFADTLTLRLRENSNEVLNFVIMLLLLVGLGVVAGFIIGRGARARQAVASSLILLLGIAFMGASVSVAQAHGGDAVSDTEPFNQSATHDDVTVTYAMTPGAGRVGTLNTLTFTATDTGGNLIPNSTFDVAFWHIEDEKPVFATTLFAPTGETSFDFQFFDGAEHEVKVNASNAPGAVELTWVIEVEGIDPPLLTKIKTTIYLVLVVFIGILIGLRIQAAQGKKHQQLTPATV